MVVLRHSGPHSALPCALSAPEVVNLYSLFASRDRVWQTPSFSTIGPANVSVSVHVFGGKSNKTSAWQTSCAERSRTSAKAEEGGGLFKQKSWAECQFPSKACVKLRWALFHSTVTQKLSQLHPAASKRAADTWAVISSPQRPLSWQLFPQL